MRGYMRIPRGCARRLRGIRTGSFCQGLRAVRARRRQKDSAVISTKLTLAPGEKDKVRFVISWYMPLAMNFWDSLKPSAEEIDPQTHSQEQILEIQNEYYEKNLWKNYYTRYFTGADECVYYCLSQWERLYEETDMYRQLLFSSTLPKDVLDAVSANVSILKSPTCLRNYDGSICF